MSDAKGYFAFKYVIYLSDGEGRETDFDEALICTSQDEHEAKAEAFDAFCGQFSDPRNRAWIEAIAKDKGLEIDGGLGITIGLPHFAYYLD
jgi:hypothetical protein